MNELQLSWKRKDNPYMLETVDEIQISYEKRLVSKEILSLLISVKTHSEILSFDITNIGQIDTILGLP